MNYAATGAWTCLIAGITYLAIWFFIEEIAVFLASQIWLAASIIITSLHKEENQPKL